MTEHVVGIAKDVPEEIKQGLRENFKRRMQRGRHVPGHEPRR